MHIDKRSQQMNLTAYCFVVFTVVNLVAKLYFSLVAYLFPHNIMCYSPNTLCMFQSHVRLKCLSVENGMEVLDFLCMVSDHVVMV